MRRQRTYFLLYLVVAILLLGVVYASISNVTFNVTGNATAAADATNFKVAFTGSVSSTGSGAVTGSASNQTATFNLTGLTTVGQSTVISIPIKNSSSDISAKLDTPMVTVGNTDYFSVTTSYTSSTIAPGGTTTLKLTVKLLKSPISDVSTTVKVTFSASPASVS